MSTMDISSMLEVQVKEETDVKENVTPGRDQASSATSTAVATISQEESNYYKLMFGNEISTVRFRRLHCTACDVHIGSAPSQINNMLEHPVLRTLLCANCRDFYGDGKFEQGDDDTDMFCRWCANGGNLYCCSYCSNTFCYKCIRRNFSAQVRKKIEADEKWKCFVCNPGDLYSARATCWALIQHIQTVRRILSHDKKMSPDEIIEKMNYDESLCCPSRNKRKRRRLDSNSEEDETYSPKPNGVPDIKRKQTRRTISRSTNGVTNRISLPPIPIRPRPMSFLSDKSFSAEPPKSATSPQNSVLNSSESIVLSQSNVMNSNTSLPSRFEPNALQQQQPQPQQQQQSSLYQTTFMNTSGSAAYIQPRLIIPSQSQSQSQLTSYQPQQASSSQSLQCKPNTMVSIPSLRDHKKPLFILPKPKEPDMTLTPNIIDLDSDSDDEPKVVEQQNKSTPIEKNGNVANKVVPVALTWENSDDDGMAEEQPLTEIHVILEKDISFSKVMSPYSQELHKFLSDAKKKMNNFFDVNAVENIQVEAQRKIKDFYCNIRDTVFQLVDINDKAIRQYNEWRRFLKTEKEASPSIDKDTSAPQEKMNIPLDMICVNESETESDAEILKDRIMEPSNLVKDSNIIKDLLLRKKTVVHCGVGDDSAHLSVDKAVQVYDIVSKDYEKSIGYSVITKTDHDAKMDDSVLDPPFTSDKNFDKYQEQFIFYLQHIEDNGIETEETKSLADLDETLIQEVAQTVPFISDFLDNIGLSASPNDQSDNFQQEKNVSDNINSLTKDDENNTLDINDKEIANNSNIKIQETNMQPSNELQQMESQKTHAGMTDADAIISDNDEANLKKNDNVISVELDTSIEEDCTIID